MSIFIAGGTVVSGYLASRSASKDRSRQGDADRAAGERQDEAVQLEADRYADWKDTYGGVEQNLSDYFGNITPDYYEAQGLEAFELEQQDSTEQLREVLAQRGIVDSGIAMQADIEMSQSRAVGRAAIRAEAPSKAREDQFRFLQAGLGLSPGTSYSQSLQSSANNMQSRANSMQSGVNSSSTAAGVATSAAVKSVGSALSDYSNRPSTPAPQQQQQQPSGGGGILGGIAKGIGSIFSDNRLKTNLNRVGTAENGLGIYTWDWTDEALTIVGDQPSKGYIAQEVQKMYPAAVTEQQGYNAINYSEIPNV